MSTVVFVVNENRPRAVELASQAAGWLEERGHTVRLPAEDAKAAGLERYGAEADDLEGLDLAVALGGDGTMLRAVHLAAPQGAPVLGVNLGRLAYLATIEPDDLCLALARFIDGDYRLENRTMVRVTVEGSAPVITLALNEAVLEHAGPGHTVHLALSIDGRFFASHVADALIIATPTGSTAYSFSAGGPVVSPRHRALLVTPVAAHTPFARTMVLDGAEEVRVDVLDHRGAVLSVDGQELGRLHRGDVVTGTVAAMPAGFVTFGDGDFYGVLKAKFGLADR